MIGSGGLSICGGGLLVGCGKSILMRCVSIGAVIMKMIRSTSMTSTNGVTLMSDIAPPPLPPVVNAMVLPSSYCRYLQLKFAVLGRSDEADLDHACVLRVGHDVGHELILGVLVRA